MIFEILKDGLDYVGTNRNQIILYYLGIIILPLVFIEAYSYHIIENCLNGMINNKDKLPDITLNSKMFLNGLKLLVLKIIYYLPVIILFAVATNIRPINYYIVTVLSLILMVLCYYISEIAGVCMVESGSFKEGLNLEKIINTLKLVGLTYVELIIATFIIILGIIGITLIVSGLLMIISNFSSMLFSIFIVLLVIAYFVFLIVIVPIYVLFKNRAIVSIYNLK
jgi:hypothetical protein